MDAEQLDALAARYGVFATTAMHAASTRRLRTVAPGLGRDNRLVDEINRMVERGRPSASRDAGRDAAK
jgi:hypothetical protein